MNLFSSCSNSWVVDANTACSAVLMFRLHKLPVCATVLNLGLHMCSCAVPDNLEEVETQARVAAREAGLGAYESTRVGNVARNNAVLEGLGFGGSSTSTSRSAPGSTDTSDSEYVPESPPPRKVRRVHRSRRRVRTPSYYESTESGR